MTLYYLSLLGGRQLCNFTQIESDAPSWVKHIERGLPTSGYSTRDGCECRITSQLSGLSGPCVTPRDPQTPRNATKLHN
jgi:hypothetical protein